MTLFCTVATLDYAIQSMYHFRLDLCALSLFLLTFSASGIRFVLRSYCAIVSLNSEVNSLEVQNLNRLAAKVSKGPSL